MREVAILEAIQLFIREFGSVDGSFQQDDFEPVEFDLRRSVHDQPHLSLERKSYI
jgi:hypothetical protein